MIEFENQSIDIASLPRYETTVFTPPERSYWRVIVLNLSIFLLIVATALGIAFYANHWTSLTYILPAMVAWLLLAVLLTYLYRLSFARRGYALRQHDMLYKSGVIVDSTIIIPLQRVQHVAIHEGIFSRMFGLATLQLYTASGNSGDMHLKGLPLATAHALQQTINQAINNLSVNEK